MDSTELRRLDHLDHLAFGETKMGEVVRGMMKAGQKVEVLNKGKDKDLEVYRRSLNHVQQSVNATIERQQTSMMQNLRRLNSAKNQAREESARIHKWLGDFKAKRNTMRAAEQSIRIKDRQSGFLCALRRASFPINFKGNISLCIPKITISDYSFCDMKNDEDLLRVRQRTLLYDDTTCYSLTAPDSDLGKESLLHVPQGSHLDERETIKRAQSRSDLNISLTLEKQDRIWVDNLGKQLYKRSQLYSASNKTLNATVGSMQRQNMYAVSEQCENIVDQLFIKASPIKRLNTKSCDKNQHSFPPISLVDLSQSQEIYSKSKNIKPAGYSASSKNLTGPIEWRNTSEHSSVTSINKDKARGSERDSSLCYNKNTLSIHKTIQTEYCPKDVASSCDQSLRLDCIFPQLHSNLEKFQNPN